MSDKTVRDYDKEFKINAVNLFLKKEKTYKQLSEELGIPEKTLIGWVYRHKKSGETCFPGKGKLKEPDMEIFNLKKKLAIAEEERDILKKALGIFSLRQK
jgi:transposase-like protein